MRGLIISVMAAAYLYGAAEPNAILNEVAKLRQKYEECRQGQSAVIGIDPKVYKECDAQRGDAMKKVKSYQTRISNLEMQVKENNALIVRLQTQNTVLSRELTQKKGVVKSLEQTLTDRDKKYRDAVALNEALNANANAVKVSKIERESMKRALVSAKTENERLQKEIAKLSSAHPDNGTGAKLQAMQTELAKAQVIIARLQKSPAQPAVQEKIVYKDRPVVQEKIVTKVVEPTEKIKALQNELAASQAMVANLKSASGMKVVYKDRIVTQEKVVYKDRPVVQEKVVYKDRPVVQEKVVTKVIEPTEKIKALQNELTASRAMVEKLKNMPNKVVVKEKIVPQEKIVYKDRPVVQEKIVTKVVEPTEKLKALQNELAAARETIATLKNAPAKVVVKEKIVPQEKVVYKDRIVTQEKVVYKDRPVVQEKIVYKDRPVEKIVTKADEATLRQIDGLSLELERQKTQNEKLRSDLAALQSKRTVAQATVKPKPLSQAAANGAVSKPTAVAEVAKASSAPAAAATSAKKGASAYRMAVNAPIYNAPNGRMIDTWEARRSFTAGLPSGGWVHITGYFVNRVWQPTREDENLWVKESDVIRR